MKKFIPSILIALFSIFAYATAPSKNSLEKLFAITVDKKLDFLKSSMSNMFYNGSLAQAEKDGKHFSPEQQEFVKKVADKFGEATALTLKNLVTPAFKEEYIKVYSETFSQEEVNAMIAYYSTPTGQKILGKSALADDKLTAKLQELVNSKEARDKIRSDLTNNLLIKQ